MDEKQKREAVKSELEKLIEKARHVKMSEEDKRQQLISFAYGNLKIEYPDLTKKFMEDVAREMSLL